MEVYSDQVHNCSSGVESGEPIPCPCASQEPHHRRVCADGLAALSGGLQITPPRF